MTRSCVFFCFVDFFFEKVFLLFKDIRDGFRLISFNVNSYANKHNF